ncbi:MAG: hypothetical protein R2731_07290 [Nocardioides sp.]
MRLAARWGPRRVAACVLACVLAAAGCSGQQSPSESGPDAVRARAVASHDRWAGDEAARQAAEYVAAHDLNAAWAECMTERGYATQWERAIAAPQLAGDPLAASIWLTAPHTTMFSTAARLEAWPLRQQEAHQRGLGDPEGRAAAACRAGTGTGAGAAGDAARRPLELAQLETAWQAALAPLGQRFGGATAWLACLDEQHVPALSDWDPAGMAQAFAEIRPAPEDVPVGSEAESPAWAVFLAQERTFADADWTCRSQHYAEAMPELPAVVSAFETAHAAAIDTMATHWREVEAKARELGWSPQRPYGVLTP